MVECYSVVCVYVCVGTLPYVCTPHHESGSAGVSLDTDFISFGCIQSRIVGSEGNSKYFEEPPYCLSVVAVSA